MDGLSDQLNTSNISGKFGRGQLVNHISYADDRPLSFSSAGMQKLYNMIQQQLQKDTETTYQPFHRDDTANI